MKLESSFLVPAPSEQVMPLFLSAPTMEACIPGCAELVQVDETHYTGRLVNEVAHVRFNAAFSAEITERDQHEVRAILRGEDKRLASSLKVEAILSVTPNGDTSDVSYTIEMAMWGKLGRMGESIFRRRTAEVEKEFVAAFTRECRAQRADGDVMTAVGQATATVPTSGLAAPESTRQDVRVPAGETGSGTRRQAATASGGVWRRLLGVLGRWIGRR